MEVTQLRAVMVANEFNLNEIAKHFGISKRFKWEDVLYLNELQLLTILKSTDNKKVYIFPFGSIVFLNMDEYEMMQAIDYLRNISTGIFVKANIDIFEDYCIDVENDIYSVGNDVLTIPINKVFYFEIVSTVLAKSVALEKIELDIDKLFDNIEVFVERLNNDRLNVKDKKLSQLCGQILTFKYNTISYIMLLDKPDMVWYNEEAEKVFSDLSFLFELDERYEKVKLKVDALMDITQMFTTLAHAKRGTRLEWIVIILIFVEIVLMLIAEF